MESAYYMPQWLTSGLIFNPNMSPQTALEILRGIVQVDGVLIGFVGLIATYLLTDIRRMYHGLPGIPSTEEREKKREQAVEKLESHRSNTLFLTAVTIGSMVLSILSALQSMSYLESYVVIERFSWPLLFMIYGTGTTLLLLVLATRLREK